MVTSIRPRALIWLALAALASGCGEAMTSDASNETGGQTGSLVPVCPQDLGKPFVVPEGQTAFAGRSTFDLEKVVVKDAQGNVIASRLARDDTTTIVTTDEVLEAGSYTIAYDCGGSVVRIEHELTVVELAPLPTDFGEMTFVEQPLVGCSLVDSVTLEWQPSAEFLPYLNLTELSLVADGADLGVIPTSGPLMLGPSEVVTVSVPLCRGVGFCAPATAIYSVTARITGFEGEWTSTDVEVNQTCLTERKEAETSCAMAVPSTGRSPTSAWLVAALAIGFGAVTRRRRRS